MVDLVYEVALACVWPLTMVWDDFGGWFSVGGYKAARGAPCYHLYTTMFVMTCEFTY